MASYSMALILALFTFSSFHFLSLTAFEFQVGGKDGWVVPPANDSKVYNDWASENRFTVGDTILFKYRKDSVLEVNESDYKRCNSTKPNFFSNTGNTVFKLNRSGLFYFISGATGHCGRGQRMIIKVMADDDSKSDGHRSSGPAAAVLFSCGAIAQFALSYLF